MTLLRTEPENLLAIDVSAQHLLFRSARTARAFTDEPVTEEQMRALHDLIKWAPTAMNTQPMRVVLLPQGPGRDRLIPLMAEGNRPKTAAAPMVAVLAADTRFHEELPAVAPHAGEALRDGLEDQHDARREMALLSASMQFGYFVIGVRALGLAAGPMSGFDAEAVSREFFPDGVHLAKVIVNIGHPAEDAYRPRNPRLDFEDVYRIV